MDRAHISDLIDSFVSGSPTTMRVLGEVLNERDRQDAKWGSDSIIARTSEAGFRVLGEETGEVAKAINERDRDQCRRELIQVAAVAVAMIEALDYGTPLVAPKNETTKGEHHEESHSTKTAR